MCQYSLAEHINQNQEQWVALGSLYDVIIFTLQFITHIFVTIVTKFLLQDDFHILNYQRMIKNYSIQDIGHHVLLSTTQNIAPCNKDCYGESLTKNQILLCEMEFDLNALITSNCVTHIIEFF